MPGPWSLPPCGWQLGWLHPELRGFASRPRGRFAFDTWVLARVVSAVHPGVLTRVDEKSPVPSENAHAPPAGPPRGAAPAHDGGGRARPATRAPAPTCRRLAASGGRVRDEDDLGRRRGGHAGHGPARRPPHARGRERGTDRCGAAR